MHVASWLPAIFKIEILQSLIVFAMLSAFIAISFSFPSMAAFTGTYNLLCALTESFVNISPGVLKLNANAIVASALAFSYVRGGYCVLLCCKNVIIWGVFLQNK